MIGVVYVPWKYYEYSEEIFASLERQGVSLELFVVPNGEPATREHIEKEVAPRHPGIKVTFVDDGGVNNGFSKGHNLGIKAAFAAGATEVFLNNGDLVLEDGALEKLHVALRSAEDIAAVQPLVKYYKDRQLINTSGGVYHLLGYAFARDNLTRESAEADFDTDIAYATGAALMVKREVVEEIGFLEEGFFMYQEDVEFGLRARMAGYRNVLVPNAVAYHDYSFGKNHQMFGWIEHYRWLIVLSYYRVPTLVLVLPLLVLHDLAMWPMAALGGWLYWKWWAFTQCFKPQTWRLFFALRERVLRLRRISDHELLLHVSGRIEAQDQSNALVENLANPLISGYVRVLKSVVRW